MCHVGVERRKLPWAETWLFGLCVDSGGSREKEEREEPEDSPGHTLSRRESSLMFPSSQDKRHIKFIGPFIS